MYCPSPSILVSNDSSSPSAARTVGIESTGCFCLLEWSPCTSISLAADLHAVDVVAVVADQAGELDLADLVELLEGEGGGPAAVLVPEAVAEAEVVELLADDAGEGGAHHRAGQGDLGDARGPHVDVVHAGVRPAGKNDA